ncbi:MAG: LamG-like jellyroll fold domain-containing protein [Ignavibacteria bacterium]
MYRIIKYFIVLLFFFSFYSVQVFSQYYYNEFASFDGANDYMSASSHAELTLDSAFTIEAWVFVKDTTGFNKTILSTVSAANNTGFALLVKGSVSNPGTAGRLQLNLNGTNNSVTQPNGTRLPLNVWSHIAVTFKDAGGNNSDSVRFYINGNQVLSATRLLEPVSNTTDSLRVGNCYIPGNYSNGLNGYIDDLRIYKTRHTIQQIANDRGVPVSMEGFTNVGMLSGSRYSVLTAAWTFDGNGNDNIGVKNNLSPVNGAVFIPQRFNPASYKNQSNYFMRFNGQGWLAAPDSANTSYDPDTACTIEAYVFLDSSSAGINQTIISKGNNYKLGISSNKFYFSINSGSKVLRSFRSVKPKEWMHIAATYRGLDGLMNIYINGILDSTKIFSEGNITTANDSLYMGKSNTGEFLFGKLDEVRISRVAKSLSFIQRYLNVNIDINNGSQFSPALNSYGFEGHTLDNVSKTKPMLIRGDAYFEWINNGSGAGQSSQAPMIRKSLQHYGWLDAMISQNIFSIRNNSTVRDSILLPFGAGALNSVTIILTHSSMDDVDISLRGSNGVTINLSTDNGGTFNDMCTEFTSQADSSLSDNIAPFSMKVKPQTSFSTFAGVNTSGYWRLTVTDDNAANVDSGRVYAWGLSFGPIPGISGNETGISYKLYQNYPNPFNPNTNLEFGISKLGFVTLKVYDILGNEVATLINEKKNPGNYKVDFNGSNLSSGIYFYKLVVDSFGETEDFNEVKKMTLIK